MSGNAVKLDPINEIEISAFCEGHAQFDLVINCVGFLHDQETQPEKSLRDINIADLQKNFLINSIVTPLWAKYLKRKFSKTDASVFATLSAMVGSIEENQIGGWYGYRASKAALNMFIKNIAIEFERSRLKTSVISIHPGTTHTDLSEPFSQGVKHKVWQPVEAAENILNVLESCSEEGSGLFKNWDGRKIEW
jgi:NAD(P)-dependent dehydrogenase (short-subunit alcohol dehydrogenase family)